MDWWSLKPLVRPELPSVSLADARARQFNPIDHFIVAKQQQHGLSLSPEAERITLIRRLYFDLVGLPPSPAEVEAFLHDESPGAYREVVERLLASPRYGERWARHWLDVVHYGDTHGYDKDKLRPNAYPYRDYVIRAFNEDKNYTRFVKEQLAGDVLWPTTVDGIVATGFIAAGPWDFIGHAEVPEEKIDGKVARHLDRDDMVATTMNSFCALTVQCAQCHDHKRDPVSMEDYYSLQAVFAALDRADRPYEPDPSVAAKKDSLSEQLLALQAALAETEKSIAALKTPELLAVEQEIAALESASAPAPVEGGQRSGQYGYHSQVAPQQDVLKWVQIDLGEAIPIDQIVLAGAEEYGFADFGFPHRFKIEVADDSEFSSPRLISDHTGQDYPRPGRSLVVFDSAGVSARFVRVTATRLWSRRMQGQALSDDWIFALGELAVVSAGKLAVAKSVSSLDSIEALPRWGKADLIDGIYGAYPLAERAGEEDVSAGVTELIALMSQSDRERQGMLAKLMEERDALTLAAVGPERLSERQELDKSLQATQAALDALPAAQMVYAGTVHTGSGTFKGRGAEGGKPRTITVLARGDVTKPGKEVGAGTVDFIPNTPSRFQLSPDHSEGARRVALAEWIVHPDNPLTWRTIVNRVWLYHFGRGIVDSPNDFGHMGQLPTHPELLDWLAVEFRDGNQSIKDLHRLIVNSATYRQRSGGNAAAEAIDGSNQFLWRMNRRKLEAEAIRDTILQVTGKLDTTMFGPGYYDFVLEKTEHSPHYQYHKHDPDDPKSHRRAIYRFLVRSQPAPFMDTLDCADPSLLVDKRNETLTALQALALLNNKFVVRMGEHFAEALEGEADPLARAIELALSREARPAELEALRAYAEAHGLAATCRVIFNLNEFAFVD